MKIEVDDLWFLDPRRIELLTKIGYVADAVALNMWRIGLENWKTKACIPEALFFKMPHAQDFLDVGLAERDPNGIYIKGANEHFAWYHDGIEQRREAGRHSATRPRDAKGRLLPRAESNETPTRPNGIQPPTPSPSPTPLTLIKEHRTKGELAARPVIDPLVENKTAKFIGAYVKAYQARYGPEHRPDLRGKVQGQIKTLLKDYPVERATELIQAYCQMDGERGWFKTKGHDFGTFIENLNPVGIALTAGLEAGSGKINWDEFFAKNGEGAS